MWMTKIVIVFIGYTAIGKDFLLLRKPNSAFIFGNYKGDEYESLKEKFHNANWESLVNEDIHIYSKLQKLLGCIRKLMRK